MPHDADTFRDSRAAATEAGSAGVPCVCESSAAMRSRWLHVVTRPLALFLILFPAAVVVGGREVVYGSARDWTIAAVLTDMVPSASAEPRASAKRGKPAANDTLPRNVAAMREAIQAAVMSGRIGDLKGAFDLNELPPDVGAGPGEDPIAHLVKSSASGDGRDVLDAISKLLELPPAVVPLGRDVENNGIYVWPHLAERDLSKLKPAEEAELVALVGSEMAVAMKSARRWTWWRVAIGADGTWHSFTRLP